MMLADGTPFVAYIQVALGVIIIVITIVLKRWGDSLPHAGDREDPSGSESERDKSKHE